MSYPEMPKEGVLELKKSPSGRRYLEKLAERYKSDIVQPGMKEFDARYGSKIKRHENKHQQQIQESKAAWERKNWEKARANSPLGHRQKFY